MDIDKKLEMLGESMVDDIDYQFIQRKHVSTMKMPKRTLVVAILSVLLLLSVVVVAATPLGGIFSDWLGGMGLHIAEKNSNVDYPLVSVEDQGIKIKVMGAVTGHDRIILSINFSGLENVEQYFHDVLGHSTIIQLDDFKLVLENGKELHPIAPYDYSIAYIGEPKNDDGSYTEYYEILGEIQNSQKVKLNINKILDKNGAWNVEFDLTYRPYKVFKIDKEFDIYEGKLTVKNVIVDSFSTTIEFTADFEKGEYPRFFRYYVPFFQSDKEVSEMKNFSGVLPHNMESGILSDGTEGYKYIMIPIPEDAIITFNVRYSDDKDIPLYTGIIDLNAFK